MNENIQKDVMLCCIGRLENDYIREYVEYYKSLGVDTICLYDNNKDGEEHFEDVIGDYINDGFVILKDYRNKEVCQLMAYNECYKEYGSEYKWIMFFDIDEFMYLNTVSNIKEYLSLDIFSAYDMIHINWLLFGDCGMVKNDGRPILERLNSHLPLDKATMYDIPDNFHIKSIIRGGLDGVIWNSTPHTPINVGRCCNASGKAAHPLSPFAPYDYRLAGLKHFTTKTAEEFAIKVKRGFPDGNPTKKEDLVRLFFTRNEPTREKVDIFKETLGVDMSHLLPSHYDGEKRKDVQIFSLCYAKKDFEFLNDSVVTPLQVGAANGTNVCELKDNEGDNISGANYFYIENTGTYWIWKNVNDAKYKGQMQYRRPLSGITEETDFDEIFSKYDVITCEPFHHPSHKVPTKEEPMVIPANTVEEGYAFSNCGDDLFILEMAIKMFHPEYAESYDKYIKRGENLYYSNGFILKAEDYDKYANFLFDCLNGYLGIANIHTKEELEEHVKYNIEVGKYIRYGTTKPSPEAIKWQTEIGGFLSERVWTLWLLHNYPLDKIYTTPYVKMEENMFT